VTIDGTGHTVIVDGNNAVTVFTLNSGVTAAISGLTIQHGFTAGNGGGINMMYAASLTVRDVTIIGNTALSGNGAAGIIVDRGTLTVISSTIADNTGGNVGGGIANLGGTVAVTNSTITGNSSGAAGGINNSRGTLTVTSSTLAGNTATFSGASGGILTTADCLLGPQCTGGVVTLTNTIVATSTGRDLAAFAGGSFAGNNNLIDDATSAGGFTDSASGNIVGHPALLGTLGNQGGTTQTIPLLPGSLAIDTGAPVGTGPAGNPVPSTDQRGVARVNGPDIGAFESQGFTATAFTVSGFPSPTTSGVMGIITVTAKDASGNTATGYSGTAHLTSSDAAAILPANGTLTNGVGTFTVTLKTPGTQTITATDTVTGSITGAQTGITVNGIAPAAVADAYPLTTGITLTVPAATGLLANDPKGTPAATITMHTDPAHGTLTLTPDGSFTYASTGGYTGSDSFTYTISNGPGTFGTGSSTATVTLTVNAASVTALTTTAPTGAGSSNGGTASAPTLRAGGSITLATTGTYNNGTTGSVSGITYSGDDPNVLSVDATGRVTALAGGTTTITVTAPNGIRTTVTVTVTAGTGTGLLAPAPAPIKHAVPVPAVAAPPVPQPAVHVTGNGTGSGGVQPQGVGVVPTATPNAQPGRH